MNPSFTIDDFAAMSPLLLILIGSFTMLLVETFAPHRKKIMPLLALFFLAIAFAAAVLPLRSTNVLLTPWLSFDGVSRLFTLLFLGIGIGTVLLSMSFFHAKEVSQGEYYFFLFSALFGLILIGMAADFLTLFLGLETLSISSYVLCGYMRNWEISRESAIKYFFMGSLAAAVLLYGIALIYGAIGSTSFATLANSFHEIADSENKLLFFGGIALVTIGLAFKSAIVPFHMWAPDVYAGAPNPVVAFMAMGTKAGAFAAFTRVFLIALPNFSLYWNEAMAVLAILTLVYANFVAIRQVQLRRFFAYSGISHAGFLLIPLAAASPDSLHALLYYLLVYSAATFGAFAVLAFIDHRAEGVYLRDLYGLFKRSPILAFVFSLSLLTLAGIPPTPGFFAKFYLFKVAFEAEYYWLVIGGLLTTILSAYYYLKMIAIMLSEAPNEAKSPTRSYPAALLGAFSFAAILFLAIFPGIFL